MTSEMDASAVGDFINKELANQIKEKPPDGGVVGRSRPELNEIKKSLDMLEGPFCIDGQNISDTGMEGDVDSESASIQ